MKKIFSLICIILFLVLQVNAEEKKEMTDEEFFRIMAELEQRQKNAKAKTLAKQKELESAKKVNQKLDEIIGVISKDK